MVNVTKASWRSKPFELTEVPLSLLALYASTLFFFNAVVTSPLLKIIYLGTTALLALLIQVTRKPLTCKTEKSDFVWIIFLLPFFYCVDKWSGSMILEVIYYAFSIFLILSYNLHHKYNKGAMKIIYVVSIINLAFIFLQVLLPQPFDVFLRQFFRTEGSHYMLDRSNNANLYTGLNYIVGDTSGYLINGIFALLYCSSIIKKKFWKIGAFALFLGVLICAKRSHLLCLVLTIGLVWYIATPPKNKVARIIGLIVFGSVAAFLLYKTMAYFTYVPMINRLVNSFNLFLQGGDMTSGRVNLAEHAWALFESNETFGIGWKVFNDYTFAKWGHTNYVNNDYIQLLVETGIVGFCLFMIPIFVLLIKTIKKVRIMTKIPGAKDSDEMKYLLFSLAIQLFAFFYRFFEVPFYAFTFFFMYTLSIIISKTVNVSEFIKRKNAEETNGKFSIT